MDFVFWNPEHQEQRGAVNVWRLRGDVKLQASHHVKFCNAAARLERCGMNPWEHDMLFDDVIAGCERGIGGARVANIPVVNVVGFALTVRTKDHVVLHGFERVVDHLERFVIDFDQFCHVVGGFSSFGVNRSHFLVLVQDFAVCQHHLLV